MHVCLEALLDHGKDDVDFGLHEDALGHRFIKSGLFFEHSDAQGRVRPIDVTVQRVPDM